MTPKAPGEQRVGNLLIAAAAERGRSIDVGVPRSRGSPYLCAAIPAATGVLDSLHKTHYRITYYHIRQTPSSMPTSALTSKYQATIPKMVRETLHLSTGDRVEFLIARDGAVRLRKAPEPASELQALEATLAPEWGSDNDEAAYADL